MKNFAALYTALDETTKTNEKVAAIEAYLAAAPPDDAAWAVYFLSGGRIKRLILSARLREWAAGEAGIPLWLFDESLEAVGDLAETIALVLPPPGQASRFSLTEWVEQRLLPLRNSEEPAQHRVLIGAWQELTDAERLVLNKLITGELRVGVSHRLVVRAIAQVSGLDAAVVAHRLMGHWQPSAEFFRDLISSETSDAHISRPYPFCLAYPLQDPPELLGEVRDWQAEWKWDGIRAQLIRRGGQTFLWSRGEELITDRFPEISELGRWLPPGTVLDGEILAWRDEAPLPFGLLQQRIGRTRLTASILDQVPVALVAFDLLELNGEDLRSYPLRMRRLWLSEQLRSFASETPLRLSPVIATGSWEQLAEQRLTSRERFAEGIMIKRLDSSYHVGRKRGDWWKWKIQPHSVDAVLTYARRGHGRRGESLYTDYTFGVWHEGELVTFAKAYTGLTDAEIREVDRWIRSNTIQRYGPVRAVRPELVFEIAFENIRVSRRHRSGIAVRFPRIVRRRTDKPASEADTLDTVRSLISPHETLPPKKR